MSPVAFWIRWILKIHGFGCVPSNILSAKEDLSNLEVIGSDENVHDAILMARKILSQFASTHATAGCRKKKKEFHVSEIILQNATRSRKREPGSTYLPCHHSVSLIWSPGFASVWLTWHSSRAIASSFPVLPFWRLSVRSELMIVAEKWHDGCLAGEETPPSSLVETYLSAATSKP